MLKMEKKAKAPEKAYLGSSQRLKEKDIREEKGQSFDLSWESESWTFSPTLWFRVGTTHNRRQEF